MSDTISGSLNTNDFPKTCGCAICQAISDGPPTGVLDNDTIIQDDFGTDAPTITATPTQFADYLVNGFWSDLGSISRQWDTSSDNNITFSISNSFSAAQADGLRMAFDSWSDVADITFTEISSNADIDIITNSQGRAFSSSSVYSNGTIASNYISIDTSQWFWQNFDELGDYALLTAIHEIGHSLGLGHTGNYNGSATYANDAQFINDSHQYSVMSYFDASNTGSNHQGEYASTPMLYDILAMQTIYGANMTTRTGDTVYGFNSNAGVDQFDFTINTVPVVAIWDAGGTDTIDASGYAQNQVINLNDGEYSNIGGSTGNVAIAIGATIENAEGGGGNDQLYGNEANNILNGRSGNDRFYGSLGNDTIDGGVGSNDTVNYDNDTLSDFTITAVNATTLTFTHNTDGYTDTLINIDTYEIGGTAYSDAYLRSLLNVDYIAMTFGGEDKSWSYKLGNVVAGSFELDSGDVGASAGTTYVSGARTNNTTLTMTNQTNNTETAYISTTTITDLTINGFEYVEVYETNAAGVTLDISGVQAGKAITGVGNDTITVTASFTDGSDSASYRIQGGSGDDTIHYTSTNVSLTALLEGGVGNDVITITGSSNVTTYGHDNDDTVHGGAGYDLVYGGDGNDTINGNDGNDNLRGEFGEDTINGGAGADTILGGDGDDTLYGGADNDRVYGQNGDDIIYGDGGNDSLYGDAGNDTIRGGDGDDFVNAGDGNDVIYGEGGVDRIFAKNDDDTVHGGDGADFLYGQFGNDTIYGDADNDTIGGGDGADIIHGGTGIDTVYGDAGNDTINGDDGDDRLYGGGNDDVIYGDAGDDALYGEAHNDTLYGGAGNDYLTGGDGNDRLEGGDDGDDLYGGNGNDTLVGGGGQDGLYGGAGDDILIGSDIDILRGDAGADTFATVVLDGLYNTYYDFQTEQGDNINITDILTGYTHGVDDINDFVSFADRGNYHDMAVSQNGDGNYTLVARVYDYADLDGLSVDDMVASGYLVANQSVL